jgi:threonine/homoserine/homoserine lactone efflux protein
MQTNPCELWPRACAALRLQYAAASTATWEGITMEPTSLLIFAGALFVAAGSPGPSIAALVARVISKGFRDVLPFLAAMWIGEAIWLSLAVFGLAFVAQTFHLAFVIVKYLGVAYLVYLAWTMWTAPVDVRDGSMPRQDSPAKLFLAGMAVTLGNPKIMMFYLALLPTIIDLASVTLVGWLELTLTMAVVLIAIDVGWVIAAAQARRLLKSRRAMKIANRISATTMAGAAAAIAAR